MENSLNVLMNTWISVDVLNAVSCYFHSIIPNHNQPLLKKQCVSIMGGIAIPNFFYKTAHHKGIIICPRHGEFLQSPHEHLKGKKCRACGYEDRHNSNGFKWKLYTFSNGRIEKIQGYEHLTLDHLLSTNVIFPSDVKLKQSEKPMIRYYWNGRTRRYFPDCYLLSSNTIVETKSEYYWKHQYDQNLAKIRACIEQGFSVRFIVWNRKHKIVHDLLWK